MRARNIWASRSEVSVPLANAALTSAMVTLIEIDGSLRRQLPSQREHHGGNQRRHGASGELHKRRELYPI